MVSQSGGRVLGVHGSVRRAHGNESGKKFGMSTDSETAQRVLRKGAHGKASHAIRVLSLVKNRYGEKERFPRGGRHAMRVGGYVIGSAEITTDALIWSNARRGT